MSVTRRRALRMGAAMVQLACAPRAFAQRTFADATGRDVKLPARPNRVLPAGPPAAVRLLAVAPDAMIGWTRAPREAETAFLPPAVAALPEVGRLTGRGGTANAETVLRARPDLVVDVGSTSATLASLARRTEEYTGIAYVLLDGSLADAPRLLRDVGTLAILPRSPSRSRHA